MSWVCEYCEAEFDTCKDLVAHIKAWHPGQSYPDCPAPPPPPEPPPEPPEPPPEPPPEEEPEYIETYRDVDIYWLPDLKLFRAQVAPGYVALEDTLQKCRASIDEILEFLEPPEEPPEGLFAQVVAAVKEWFEENIASRLQPVYDFIDSLFAGARDAWEGLVADTQDWASNIFAGIDDSLGILWGRWDTLTTETMPGIWDTITEKVGEVSDALREARVDLGIAIELGLADMTAYVDERITVWDPYGFLKDPGEWVGTKFWQLMGEWAQGAAKSLWEGLEEGLEK